MSAVETADKEARVTEIKTVIIFTTIRGRSLPVTKNCNRPKAVTRKRFGVMCRIEPTKPPPLH